MKTTFELVIERFAEIDQDVTQQTIWDVTKRAINLSRCNPQLTRKQLVTVLIPDYREVKMKRGKKIIRGRCGCGKPAQLSWFSVKFCYDCWDDLLSKRKSFIKLFEEAEKKGKDGKT